MGDIYPLPDMFDIDEDEVCRQARLPSSQRDFTPTFRGWVGILAVTVMVSLGVLRLVGDDAGVGWMIASAVIGYVVGTVGWAVIRQELDARADDEHVAGRR